MVGLQISGFQSGPGTRGLGSGRVRVQKVVGFGFERKTRNPIGSGSGPIPGPDVNH